METQVSGAAQRLAFSNRVKTTMVFVSEGEKGQEFSEKERGLDDTVGCF